MLQSLARSVRATASYSPTASTSTLRPFSSSASPSFLFNRPKAPTANKLLKELDQAQKNDRLDLISKLYPSLVTESQSRPPLPSQLNHDLLQSVMRFVSRTNKFNLLLRIFNDLPALGFTPNHMDHHILLVGMASSGKLDKALKWIHAMKASHGMRPAPADWNVIINGYRQAGDLEGMRSVVDKMRKAGAEPNVVTFNSLISAAFELGQLSEVRKTVEEMASSGVTADLWTETALLTGFVEAGELGSAREVQRRLLARLKSGEESEGLDEAALNGLLKLEVVERGFGGGLELAERWRDEGRPLNERSLSTLAVEGAKGLRTVEEGVRLLEDLEDATGLAADRRAWSIVLQGLLAGPGGLPEALKLHQEARDRSIQPDSTMIQPLLTALLSPSSSASPESLSVAKELYDDLSQASRAYSTSPDHSIYITLLRACADPIHPDLDFSRTLIADMRERGVRLDGASAPWHIIALMRASSSYEEAFQAYDQIRALDVTALDQKAYNAILSAFTSLSFPSSPLSNSDDLTAPQLLIMEFLSDMRHSSPPSPPNSYTYSLLLTYYSRTSSASASQIAHLHSLLKLDINLDPDTALFNSLMGAYSRVGAFNAAYRVWETMLANSRNEATRVDQTSLSILLDTCGHDGAATALNRAERVWRDVAEGRVEGIEKRNRNNWEAYVECMCRFGRFEEAEKGVFEEMGVRGEPSPTSSTLEILLKMTRRGGDERWKSVRERVLREMPELWGEVKDVAPFGEEGDLQVPKA
ncbi:hypothetical protein BCR35DRAFT_298894 [Leucosporidium creatinivorum]|uniref:Pentacotripeptide-repeat region of PRORP domain-containing protein n=1 Tax=Leucosporidium creatinivorum TaxID=106004 RepID=A0A1Y2G2R6_9BASI|nr:hypothetical protein BCR35DRAFT_298894 [Leucosporidium creatinivorum]